MSKQVKFVDKEMNVLGGIELDDGRVVSLKPYCTKHSLV